jgi:hypothetical protein
MSPLSGGKGRDREELEAKPTMESKAGGGPRSADRFARATALLRALTGIQDARIEADTAGIRTIVVTADPGASTWEVTRNVQSALLASLGLAVERAVVQVRHSGHEAPAGLATATPPPRAGGNGGGNGKSNGNGRMAVPAARSLPRTVLVAEVAGAPTRGASIARLELETRGEGRLACRVVLVLGGRIAAGEAEGEDTTRGRQETAARAVIAAAPAAGAELDGLRQVELTGRDYIMVAVRSWSGRELICRAGVATLEVSPEAAAARAALDALFW